MVGNTNCSMTDRKYGTHTISGRTEGAGARASIRRQQIWNAGLRPSSLFTRHILCHRQHHPQLGRVVEFHTVFRGRSCVVHVRIQIRRRAIRFGLSSRRLSMISAIKKVRAIAITEDKAADFHLSKANSISPVINMKSTPSLTISFITLCVCLSMRASTSSDVGAKEPDQNYSCYTRHA